MFAGPSPNAPALAAAGGGQPILTPGGSFGACASRAHGRIVDTAQPWHHAVPTLPHASDAQLCAHGAPRHSVPPPLCALAGGSGASPGQLDYPHGVAPAPDGSVVCADTRNHRVQIFVQARAAQHEAPRRVSCGP
jgi:hypothetical protein